MEHTLVAVFDNESQARHALDDLVGEGFPRDEVHLHSDRQAAAPTDMLSASTSARVDESSGERVKSFFGELFDSDHDAGHADVYCEAVGRGNTVLTMRVDDDQLERASQIVNHHNPIDMDDRVSQWKHDGWTASQPAMVHEDRIENAVTGRSAAGEETVGMGGDRFGTVRVHTHAAETGLSDRLTPETRQTEPLRTDAMASGGALTDDTDFRQHWQSSHGQSGRDVSGESYEDYADAYRYGSTLAGDERYRGYRWDEAEPRMRQDWESQHAGTSWEKAKNAVRYSWEKMTR